MNAKAVADYLMDHEITVTVTGGKPALRRPPHMAVEVFEHHVERIRSDLARHRDEILKDYQSLYEPPAVPTVPVSPKDKRQSLFSRLSACAALHPGSVVVGYSAYDRSTARLPPRADRFPAHWSMSAVARVGRTDTLLCHWVDLPDCRPPARWKAPKGWVPTWNLAPPLGWTPPKVTKKDRAKRWWRKWREETTWTHATD